MAQAFYYSFETREVINPLDSVTHFYVNPYMPESARVLCLKETASGVENLEVDWTNTGLPVVLFPISLLKLNTVLVTVSSEEKVIIKKGNTRMYVKFTGDPKVIRIDTVLN